MKKLILPQILVGVLCLQLLLAGILQWQSNSYASYKATDVFLAFDQAAITRLEIDDGEQSAVVSLKDGAWLLPDNQALPVNKAKVEELLNTFADLKPGLPVASTSSSHAQLDVANDDYQRNVRLFIGDETVANLFIGTSPGFRKAHIRRDSDEQTFAGKLNSYELSAKPGDWLDKSLLAFSDISRIKGADFELVLSDDNWELVDPSTDAEGRRQLDQALVETTVKSLEALRVTGIAEPEPDDVENNEDAENIKLKLTAEDREVELSLEKNDDKVTAARNDIRGTFTLSTSVFDTLTIVSSETLWVAAE